MKILDKAKMYELLQRGRFGNIARAWNSLQEVLDSGYRGEVSMRSQEINNPVRKYHVPIDQLKQVYDELPVSQRSSRIVFSESPPDESRILQGELSRSPAGLDRIHGSLVFRYTRSPLPMRLAFEADWKARYEARTMPVGDGGHAYGLRALHLLQQNLYPPDLDDLLALLDDFEDHIIEFSVFNRPVGVIPGRRMLVWEVRLY